MNRILWIGRIPAAEIPDPLIERLDRVIPLHLCDDGRCGNDRVCRIGFVPCSDLYSDDRGCGLGAVGYAL